MTTVREYLSGLTTQRLKDGSLNIASTTDGRVALEVWTGPVGEGAPLLWVAWTPEQARQTAALILEMAEDAEATTTPTEGARS